MPRNAPPKPAARHNPEKPWNALPELPPVAEIESKEILKACISARAELARVNALVEILPNKDILLHAIPLQEARSSSEIENIVTSGDALYQALAGGGAGADAGCGVGKALDRVPVGAHLQMAFAYINTGNPLHRNFPVTAE